MKWSPVFFDLRVFSVLQRVVSSDKITGGSFAVCAVIVFGGVKRRLKEFGLLVVHTAEHVGVVTLRIGRMIGV
ncbi:MAG: hypothetical protein HQM04_15685 [Magnetococcales bacterium]|nr:hypothetical protein [Magnetococcales bacterium]MBF0116469.1 hypothetical protein [Magnetococcales bacterium]